MLVPDAQNAQIITPDWIAFVRNFALNVQRFDSKQGTLIGEPTALAQLDNVDESQASYLAVRPCSSFQQVTSRCLVSHGSTATAGVCRGSARRRSSAIPSWRPLVTVLRSSARTSRETSMSGSSVKDRNVA